MLTLMKPTYFIPIHGELRMLHHHRMLAESVGVEPGNSFILNNGDVVDIENSMARQTRSVQAGNIYVDGIGVGDVGDVVLRDRKQLSEDGMLVIILSMGKRDGKLVSDPDTITRGFVYARNNEELLKDVNRLVSKTVHEQSGRNKNDWGSIKQQIKKSVGQYLFAQTKRKPMILPIIIEV
jgi:ribonuclease J